MLETTITTPVISVVMPVYNAAEFVGEAVESILSQTTRDFELIIIDDGSTDRSREICHRYAGSDSRIRLVFNENNQGIAKSLNKGITLAQGKYIARMDADDISLPDRLEKQLNYLEEHPEVAALGGSVRCFDQNGNFVRQSGYVRRPQQVKWETFFGNNAAHPTIMIRRSLFTDCGIQYNEDLKTTQDFDLWVQITRNHQLANLTDVLVKIRIVASGISQRFSDTQRENNLAIRRRLITDVVKINFSDETIDTIKKPFESGSFFNSLSASVLLILLQMSFHISSLEKIDRDYIKKNVAFRISKIIRNSEHKYLLFPFRLYALTLRGELITSLKKKLVKLLYFRNA